MKIYAMIFHVIATAVPDAAAAAVTADTTNCITRSYLVTECNHFSISCFDAVWLQY